MTSSKIKRPVSIKQKSKGGQKATILKEKEKAKKTTVPATAIMKAKGKSVKVEKKIITKAKVVVKKKVMAPIKRKVKAVVAKKVTAPIKQKAKAVVAKKAMAPAKHKLKVAVVKKASAPVKQKTKASAVKKVATSVKQKVKTIALKKVIKPTNGEVKKTELKAKTRSPKAKEEIVIESSIISPINVSGEDLHFIPEHDAVTIPVTPTEAHKKETIFQHKEKVAFHQENLKVRDALPSRKTMKIFSHNKRGN